MYEYRVTARNANGTSPPSQTAQATANQSNLTAHRPQSVFPLENPADAPNYDTFPRRPVREQDEQSNTLGPGIRINRDDDNFNTIADAFESGNEIERENDLIEVKVDRLPGQGDLVLVAGAQLSLYYDHDKETPIPLEDGHTEPLPLVGNTITVFAEWSDSDHGFANLSLVELSSSTTLDVVRFHTFRSLIIAFGGNTQNPADTDGDGSIGDPVQGGPAGNREGIFDIAQSMYDTGWDVLAFDEEDVDSFDDIPYTEIKSAVFERSVEFYAVIGYSQGGGAVHDIIERLWDDDDIVSGVGVFLDAVDHDGAFAENDWPDAVFYLLNIYQSNSGFMGGDIDDEEVLDGATLEEVNVTIDSGWNHNLIHTSIDDDPQVQQLIRTRLQQLLLNR